jgi:hypothetical protein
MLYESHATVGPCLQAMARPGLADREDDLQICRIAANVLNKQSQTARKEWFSSLGVGRGDKNTAQKKKFVTKYHTGP